MIDINYRQMMMIMLPLMGRRIVGRLMNSILTQLYHDQRSSSANNMPRGGVLDKKIPAAHATTILLSVKYRRPLITASQPA